MEKYSKKQAACAQTIETLGGDYALTWDDDTQISVNAHAALLSQFAKAGGFFDRLVETCPMRLTSNNAPEVRDLIATAMVSMVNGATRFRHFDRLHGDAATAGLFGVKRFMSCDSVRRNFASIPEDKALTWAWRDNLHLLQDVVAEDYVLDLDPTVKPVYGHQEGRKSDTTRRSPDARLTATTRCASPSSGWCLRSWCIRGTRPRGRIRTRCWRSTSRSSQP